MYQEPNLSHVSPLPTHDSRSIDASQAVGAGPANRAPGLTAAEAQRRLQQYGLNALPEHTVNPLLTFLTYFWGPIPWMIEVAVLLSALVRHWDDFAIISVLLLANAIVGFWEEYQAGNTIAALKQSLALQARVCRDGTWAVIPARDLVPGDLLHVRLGDIVPADLHLVAGSPLEVDQSALTGESLPVTRGAGEAVYAGAIIRQGEGDALVDATGPSTYFGKTAALVETAHSVSHFQRAVLRIGNYLIGLAVVLVALILLVSLLRGNDLTTVLLFSLVLTVAAIPVALPTVLSVTMAVGARLLASEQAVVSRLAAIEELAGVDVLCSDKTGTLTQNSLTLGEPYTLPGVSREELMRAAALASRAESGDPIDLAVLGGVTPDLSLPQYHVTAFVPFDPVQKRTEATVQGPDGQTVTVSKGAPQVILALLPDPTLASASVDSAVQTFARRGFRALGVAQRADGGAWRYLGVLPLYDPPRTDSKDTIATAQALGVQVKMVTGDQVAIGQEIARQVGLGTRILDAGSLDGAAESGDSGLATLVEQADGFAQVFPAHKYRIVTALQQHGHIVGMTGDGVNDAPALKQADAGIAVSGATDAARAAAAIVLLTPGLSVIVRAIEESRRIFQRMQSYAIYRITETIRVLLFMTLSILIFNFFPVTAVMIVLIALLNDGAILSIAVDRAEASRSPEVWQMPRVLTVATVLGVTGVVASFGLFALAEKVFQLGRPAIQSLMYLKLSVAGHLTIFLTRTRGPFWSRRPAPILLGAVVGTQALATVIAVSGILMTPLGWGWALFVWGYALAWFVVNDQVKLLTYRLLDRRQHEAGRNAARAPAASA